MVLVGELLLQVSNEKGMTRRQRNLLVVNRVADSVLSTFTLSLSSLSFAALSATAVFVATVELWKWLARRGAWPWLARVSGGNVVLPEKVNDEKA